MEDINKTIKRLLKSYDVDGAINMVVENNIYERDDGGFACSICGKTSKRNGTLINHIYRDHHALILGGVFDEVVNRLEVGVESRHDKIAELINVHKDQYEMCLNKLNDAMSSCKNSLANDDVIGGGMASFMEWNLKALIITEKQYTTIQRLKNIPETSANDAYEWMCGFIDGSREELLKNDISHRSTSVMDHVIAVFKFEAMQDIVGSSFSRIMSLKLFLEEYSKIENILANYKEALKDAIGDAIQQLKNS